jgi:hypothetical protein
VLDAYAEIGAAPPSQILWAQSPTQALQIATRGQLWRQIGDPIRDQLRYDIGHQLQAQLRKQLQSRFSIQIDLSLLVQLWVQLQSGPTIWVGWGRVWSWGQSESHWIGYYRFAIELGVEVTPAQDRQLQIWERLARAAYMVLSWPDVTILVQHPSIVALDEQRRLHRTDGPALAWPDGYGVYAVHGVQLSSEQGHAMVARTLTAAQIRDEPNAEVRRVLVAAYNAGDTGRYLRDLGAQVIHADVDALGLPRRLLRIDQPDDEPIVAIEVTNSTSEPDGSRKIYTFRCHPELRPLQVPGIRDELGEPQALTCRNAIASTYGYYGEEFRLAIET